MLARTTTHKHTQTHSQFGCVQVYNQTIRRYTTLYIYKNENCYQHQINIDIYIYTKQLNCLYIQCECEFIGYRRELPHSKRGSYKADPNYFQFYIYAVYVCLSFVHFSVTPFSHEFQFSICVVKAIVSRSPIVIFFLSAICLCPLYNYNNIFSFFVNPEKEKQIGETAKNVGSSRYTYQNVHFNACSLCC